MCPCCGKFVVYLRTEHHGSKTDFRWWRVCYYKSWDGNPWFIPGAHAPHPKKRWKKWADENREPDGPPVDPFFSLD